MVVCPSLQWHRRRLDEHERSWARAFSTGGADYDGPAANAETVLRVLSGSPRRPGDKVLPRTGVRSVFICFAGHGGSFPAVPRLSELHYTTKCDLCGRVHRRRKIREIAAAAWSWLRWVHQDCNPAFRGAEQTQSSEHDQLLFEGETVLTPFGPGRVIGRCVVLCFAS